MEENKRISEGIVEMVNSFTTNVTVECNKYPNCFNFGRSHSAVFNGQCFHFVTMLFKPEDVSIQGLQCYHRRHQYFKLLL